LHIGKSTAARALEILADRGFIVAEKRGAFSLKARHATEWRLTEFASDIGSDFATKEFVRWRPEDKIRYPERDRTVSPAGPHGICTGTAPDSNTSHGISSGTVSADCQLPRYP